MTEKCDILLDILDEDLPKLAEMYEKHKEQIPDVYGIITAGIDWRKKSKEKYMKFMSPNGVWRDDGTFFVLLAHYCFDIYLFSLDDTGKSIYEGIRRTKRFDTGDYKDRQALLHTSHEKFYPIAIKAFKDQGKAVSSELISYRVSIHREEALNFKIDCPQEVYIKKLDRTHADIVNTVWPHHYKNSVKIVTLLIEMNDSYGLFLKSTDELVACTVLSMLGQLGMVQTVDAHKKKGYASLIVKYASKKIAQKGHHPFATVLTNNTAAIGMFKKLGFKKLGKAFFTNIK